MGEMTEKTTPRVDYNRSGTICAKGQMLDDQLHGYWEWYRQDGTLKRSGQFDRGRRVGEWTTYDLSGVPYKVTRMKPTN
jgi:antitoxin component YwqK of YwqJK toxin-antitoxin module